MATVALQILQILQLLPITVLWYISFSISFVRDKCDDFMVEIFRLHLRPSKKGALNPSKKNIPVYYFHCCVKLMNKGKRTRKICQHILYIR